ncbi:MAG: cysteine--tRNA ligase [Bacteroidota bacterium]
MEPLKLYNTYTRRLEEFEPINGPFVGLYVCGPTVYGPPHLGHSRGPITFDVLHRYLIHRGYKVRYVRNITDVGHLVDDADEGEDKIAKKARLEKLEPMEIAQLYTNSYREAIGRLNILPPSIEPLASGHIPEQIAMIAKIIEQGLAYESNGSVYFDVMKYAETHDYGKLSGRVLEDLMAGAGNAARELEGQDEKRNANDFALWKKAAPEHIMRWDSPWSVGFPGWHIECSAMSNKYLGQEFDIHGGGMDLLFPHHESEIAQSTACHHKQPAKYWLHHNMITVNGQKMAKSLGNGINMMDLYEGTNHLLEKPYSPMTLKFFVLQAHYRGTLDFSNEALQAAEKGLARLFNAYKLVDGLKTSATSTSDIQAVMNDAYAAMNEDLNTPITIAQLFEAARITNSVNDGKETITEADKTLLKQLFDTFLVDVLGLKEEEKGSDGLVDDLMQLIITLRKEARDKKDFATSDIIRDRLKEAGVQLKDGKEGTTFSVEN